jgi:hypothetical protein
MQGNGSLSGKGIPYLWKASFVDIFAFSYGEERNDKAKRRVKKRYFPQSV